jgi:hypothetical protein
MARLAFGYSAPCDAMIRALGKRKIAYPQRRDLR